MNKTNNSIINDLSFCVIDLETTGSLPQKDRIIDIGMIKLNGFEVVDEKNFLVNPQKHIPKFIQRLTKISQKDVEHAPVIEDIIDEVIEFIGDSILVAHNISFDIPFLNGVLSRLGKPLLNNKTLCTHLMTKHLIPEIISSNLTYLNQLFELPKFKAHRALEDARMTAHLLTHYLNIFSKRNLSKINHLYYPLNKFELHKQLLHKQEQTQLIEMMSQISGPFHLTLKSDEGVLLASIPVSKYSDDIDYLNEAINKYPWEKASIQLLNSYFEGLQDLEKHFMRLPTDEKEGLIPYLQSRWSNNGSVELGEYLVSHHMIPEQFVVHSLNAPRKFKKNIYRYPNHQKKLFHQVRKWGEISSKKKKAPLPHPLLAEVTKSYLCQNSDQYLFMNYADFIDAPEQSWKMISKLLKFKERKPLKSFPIWHL